MFSTETQTLVDRTRGRLVSDIVRLQARRTPAKTALVYEGHRDTYAELDRLVDRTANALRARGVTEGDRVAVFSHNNRAYVVLRFAIIRAGAVFTPINFMLGAAEVAYILEHAGARAVVAEDALAAICEEAFALMASPPTLKAYVRHADVAAPAGWADADAWLDHIDASPLRSNRGEDDPVQLMYTSGTESRPKGALLSSRCLMAQYVSCIVDGGMDAADVELHCLPLYHCAQLDCFLSVDLYLGATSILLRAPDPAAMLATIETERVTKLFCPPTVWISLLRHPDFERRDLSSLVKGYYGASIMPTAIIEELLRRLPGLRLWNFYGQTEMAPMATVLKPQDQLRKLGSAGVPAINVETRIVDDDDNDVPLGEVGEIVHRSPQAMLGYHDDDAKTADAFRNGWFHSGDLGRLDEDGYLYVVDRKKDMIKTGGENVASREIEEVLFAHPRVAEAAVFGVPHERWIEAVTAVVVARSGEALEADELEAHCRDNLAGYKRPKRIVVVEALPKNASGKILKRELRDRFAAVTPTSAGPS
ncbi:MAG: long-chain-fatty-acid--CoA ligase [Phenylobacterium sp.]|uniref:fatty acyl-CoA synthetase n=1 Tax=Phenylobacterium sp. TaxID=1871053 RepID=UPI001228437B|nr:fatty acyl-CoA synthetase [Phenylobacterium sp.]TAJ69815.1 MAG: long-chain-fatty-acid--CoA ligase [Phenylobacterium sp.]